MIPRTMRRCGRGSACDPAGGPGLHRRHRIHRIRRPCRRAARRARGRDSPARPTPRWSWASAYPTSRWRPPPRRPPRARDRPGCRDPRGDRLEADGPRRRGFPTGRKWDAVAKQSARPHYLICNADESEPGTFKDRVLLDGDPFAIVEAMTIAGFATGCERGFLYIRGEYPLGAERMQHAIDEARAHGFLGDDILGRGVRFDIEIRRGAGAYICGEETAIFNSIEGYRGEPRNKPPFPGAGRIVRPADGRQQRRDARQHSVDRAATAARRSRGSAPSSPPARKLFCLSGNVERAGRLRGGVRQDAARSDRHGRRRRRTDERSRRCCSAARPACSSARTSWTCRSRSRARARRRRRSGSGVIIAFDDTVDMARDPAPHRGVLPRRVVRPVRAVPRRNRAPGRSAVSDRQRTDARRRSSGGRAARRGRASR